MMFMSMEFMKEIPFKYVFIHGLVRDSQGRKCPNPWATASILWK